MQALTKTSLSGSLIGLRPHKTAADCPSTTTAGRGYRPATSRFAGTRKRDAKLVGMLALGRVEVLGVHGLQQCFVRDFPAAPGSALAAGLLLDRHETCQGLADPRDDNLFAGERPVEQRGQLCLCFGDIDLDGHGCMLSNVLVIAGASRMINQIGHKS